MFVNIVHVKLIASEQWLHKKQHTYIHTEEWAQGKLEYWKKKRHRYNEVMKTGKASTNFLISVSPLEPPGWTSWISHHLISYFEHLLKPNFPGALKLCPTKTGNEHTHTYTHTVFNVKTAMENLTLGATVYLVRSRHVVGEKTSWKAWRRRFFDLTHSANCLKYVSTPL